jgi:hypothetical protein
MTSWLSPKRSPAELVACNCFLLHSLTLFSGAVAMLERLVLMWLAHQTPTTSGFGTFAFEIHSTQ